MAIYRKHTLLGRKLEFEEGERHCPECGGRGSKIGGIKSGNYTLAVKTVCGYCQGCGKTDWIQDATGIPRVDPPPEESIQYMKDNLGAFAALWLRKEIDKEIINSLITSGLGASAIHYEMMKQLAKNVGVAVVTASQINPKVSLGAAHPAMVRVSGTGLIGLEVSERSMRNTLISYLTQGTQSRRRSKRGKKKNIKK